MKQPILCALALAFVLTGAVPAKAQTTLHGSANSIVERALLRKAARLTEQSKIRRRSSSSRSSSSSVKPSQSRAMLRRDRRLQEHRAESPTGNVLAEELLAAINTERARSAHAALKPNAKLALAAQRHADDMIARNYFDHENPEGLRVGDRVRATGYGDINSQECRCSYRISIGENLAKGQKTVNHVIQSWLDSPLHREAMLSDAYKEIGIGLAGDVWVLNFGGIDFGTSQSDSNQ